MWRRGRAERPSAPPSLLAREVRESALQDKVGLVSSFVPELPSPEEGFKGYSPMEEELKLITCRIYQEDWQRLQRFFPGGYNKAIRELIRIGLNKLETKQGGVAVPLPKLEEGD